MIQQDRLLGARRPRVTGCPERAAVCLEVAGAGVLSEMLPRDRSVSRAPSSRAEWGATTPLGVKGASEAKTALGVKGCSEVAKGALPLDKASAASAQQAAWRRSQAIKGQVAPSRCGSQTRVRVGRPVPVIVARPHGRSRQAHPRRRRTSRRCSNTGSRGDPGPGEPPHSREPVLGASLEGVSAGAAGCSDTCRKSAVRAGRWAANPDGARRHGRGAEPRPRREALSPPREALVWLTASSASVEAYEKTSA